MPRPSLQLSRLIFILLALNLAVSLHAQSLPATFKPDYPESTSGLEHLVKDILKAQAKNDGARADALLRSMILPQAYDWYDRSFDRDAADIAGEYYEKISPSIAPFLAHTFVDIQQQDFSRIKTLRYENSCDDDASDDAYGVLLRRREPFPLYEVRFQNGNKFIRIFPIVFVDGAFRYILPPDYRPPASTQKNLPEDKNPPRVNSTPPERRVNLNGTVQASKLISKVQPVYPSKARSEHVSGTVKVHVIIGKDGQISHINGVRGACSLAESAVTAVRKWRYTPTLLNGTPVEVDTEIDVIFALTQ